jgi:hypothetical protein
MVKLALVGAAMLVLGLFYAAAAPWLKRYAIPPDACARWATDGARIEPPFTRQGEHAYVVRVAPQSPQESDDTVHPRRSTALLCEDGKIVGTAHSPHDDIRKKGNGRYSHWAGALYFSTSDNTDPNENRRQYQLVFPPRWHALVFPQ